MNTLNLVKPRSIRNLIMTLLILKASLVDSVPAICSHQLCITQDFSSEHRKRFTHPEGILMACQYGTLIMAFGLVFSKRFRCWISPSSLEFVAEKKTLIWGFTNHLLVLGLSPFLLRSSPETSKLSLGPEVPVAIARTWSIWNNLCASCCIISCDFENGDLNSFQLIV